LRLIRNLEKNKILIILQHSLICKNFAIKDLHVKESLRLCIGCQPIREINFSKQTQHLKICSMRFLLFLLLFVACSPNGQNAATPPQSATTVSSPPPLVANRYNVSLIMDGVYDGTDSSTGAYYII